MSNAVELNERTKNELIKDTATEMAGNGDVWQLGGTERTSETHIQQTVQNVVQEPYQQSSADKNISEVPSEETIPKDDATGTHEESTVETIQDSYPKQLDSTQCANEEENKTQRENGANDRSQDVEQDQAKPDGEEEKENPGVVLHVPDSNSEIYSSTDERASSEGTENNSETEKCDKDSNQCDRACGNVENCSKGARPKANKKKPGIFRSYGGDGPDKPSKKDKKKAENETSSRRKNRFKQEPYEDLPDESEQFEYFWQNPSVFSQWYPSEFFVDEFLYNCAEQYMMHQKAVLMDDIEHAEIIMSLTEPREIKNVGRHVQNFNQELWDNKCKEIVKKGNIAKFSQNDRMKKKLFATYPKTLVEASPLDKVWGIGLAKDDRRAWNRKTWKGENRLGYILTEVRNELMKDAGIPVENDCNNSAQSQPESYIPVQPELTEQKCSINVAENDQEFIETDVTQTDHKDEGLVKPDDSNITPKDEVTLDADNKSDTQN